MTAKTAPLRFTRDKLNAGYDARSDTHRYLVTRYKRGWLLTVQELTETAGVKHVVGQPIIARSEDDTRALAYAVANAYHQLGDDCDKLFADLSRMTQAIRRAYEES